MDKKVTSLTGIAAKVQISLAILSVVGIAFSIVTYKEMKHLYDTPEILFSRVEFQIFAQIAIALAFNIGLGMMIFNKITKPVTVLSKAMEKFSEGDLSGEVPYTQYHDEIGVLAQKVEQFKEKQQEFIAKEAIMAEMKNKGEVEKRKEIAEKLAVEFDDKIVGITKQFKDTVSRLQESSKELNGSSKKSSEFLNNLLLEAEHTSENVSSIAQAAEELTSSISEISNQTGKSTAIADDAAYKVSNTNEQIQVLADAAEKIGHVIELINDIAEQINLLALNATIEAARAGEAGKGFAVVATEVKNLAEQTANATDEISFLIRDIQNRTGNAVGSMQEINVTIETINEITKNIADAIEEQSSATKEIARTIQQAANNTENVQENVKNAAQSFNEVEGFANMIANEGKNVSNKVIHLDNEVNKFFKNIRESA